MTIRPATTLIMAVGCLLSTSCATIAPLAEIETDSPTDEGVSAAVDSAVMRTANAIALGEAGARSKDVATLVQAASMLDALGAKPTGKSEEDIARKWIDLAASQDPEAKLPVYRGRALGPAYRKGTVTAGSDVTMEQIFLAGKKASVALVPVSKNIVSISIENGDGKRLCHRTVSTKPDSCEWLPLFTDRFLIRVKTKAREPVRYYLVSN
ncbi:hypothetical protein [Parasphingorhabdus halotolerans]|uniref:Lipoprotein n=1 Tax=Parasphingorhabdus halotolerans TaxID=2725558 RepID=A0A6H2DQJ2_9SPHN|nr:hypothetical protein [Parasphingorhabdus halotolerans]QJB70468.1 hypothetical protein HF685_15350 [Parasphingorhabdus halotolerans]